jgi:peptidoglycan hydrolase-like protein with peptidoglycan-binding domain
MSATIKEILMDWLDINEFHNVRIDSKNKCYADTLACDEEFYIMAKTNADNGDAVEINLNLLDKTQAILKSVELESHVENEEVKMTLKVEDLSKEHNLDLNAIKGVSATLLYEKEKYPTNKARIFRTLKSKELSDNGELNDVVEGRVAKAYKKAKGTTPNSTGAEVKLIQTALQKMNVSIGDAGVDGVFGKDGHNATMTFQENYKPSHNVHQYTWAEPDGVVGKNTLLAMDEALVSGWKYQNKRKRRDTKLGTLSSKYETGGRGSSTVSGGVGDWGGISYGAYQLTSKPNGGNAKKFVNSSKFKWKNEFKSLKAGTSEFSKKWKETVKTHGKEFKTIEHDYIKNTHFDPQIEKIKLKSGKDLRYHSHALNDVIWSTSVQMGPQSKVVLNAMDKVKISYSETKEYDKELIQEIYNERGRKKSNGDLVYFSKNSQNIQLGVSKRFVSESKLAIQRLNNEADY